MRRFEPTSRALKLLLVTLCLLTIAATLSAGLWPFSFHVDNEISWKAGQKGLYFGDYGMLISKGEFNGIPDNQGNGYSVEIWLEPSLTWDSNTILTFYQRDNAQRISVHQSGDDLVLAEFPVFRKAQMKPKSFFVDHIFRKGEQVLITLTSIEGQSDIYVNGVLKKTLKNFELTGQDFSGILVLGTSPFGTATWSGTFRGLAFYDRALGSEEVKQNYAYWQNDRQQSTVQFKQPYSLYLFDEQGGDILYNRGRGGPDLMIPKYFFIFHPEFLTPFWKEFQPHWNYLKDVALNIFGFIPLGFCFAALFAWLGGGGRTLVYTMVLGFFVSLTIEVLQAFMPMRFSGTTDLITNTSGTALGALFYLNRHTQVLVKQLGLIRAD